MGEVFMFIVLSLLIGFVIHVLDEGIQGWLKGRAARRAGRKSVG